MSGHGGGRAKECDGWEGGCGAGACAGGAGGGGSGGLRCIGVLLPAAPLECGLGHAGGGGECRGAEDGKNGAARKDGG